MNPCPKCHYLRQAKDVAVHQDICPACGIAINKWRARTSADAHTDADTDAHTHTARRGLIEHFMQLPAHVEHTSLWARATLSVGLALWALAFMAHGIDWEWIGSSFMHNINLPFHEFGHVLFMPLGRFMTILGGSLFQIALPLMLMIAFSFYQQDNYAASVTLWWCGQSFVDLAPYIADAPYRALPLVGGGGEESHDWGNLLSMTGHLQSAQSLARVSFFLGSVIMLVALCWGVGLLLKQRALLRDRQQHY